MTTKPIPLAVRKQKALWQLAMVAALSAGFVLGAVILGEGVAALYLTAWCAVILICGLEFVRRARR